MPRFAVLPRKVLASTRLVIWIVDARHSHRFHLLPVFENKGTFSSPFLSISRGESFSDDDFCTGEGQGQVTRRKEVRRRVHIGQNTRDLYLRWGFLLLREEREERAEAGFYFFLHLICKVLFPPSIFLSFSPFPSIVARSPLHARERENNVDSILFFFFPSWKRGSACSFSRDSL